MATVLPVMVGGRAVGSAVAVEKRKKRVAFATALHVLADSSDVKVILPPHGGNCLTPQTYPVTQVTFAEAFVAAADPFSDLAILVLGSPDEHPVPRLKIADRPFALGVGQQVVVLGYPFAPIGSILETWSPGYITAHAKREVGPGMAVEELVLSNVSHPGSSGSAVVGMRDGTLYGILRGALAPPEVLRIGDVPIATDTSVTFATSAHLLHDLLNTAFSTAEASGV